MPQIIQQAIKGYVIETDYSVTIIYAFSRFLWWFYFKACSENIDEQKPHYWVLLAVFGSIIIQHIILKLQEELGPDIVLPSMFKPKKFNYFVTIKKKKNRLNDKKVSDTDVEENLDINKLCELNIFESGDKCLSNSNNLIDDSEENIKEDNSLDTIATKLTQDDTDSNSKKFEINDESDEESLCAICMTDIVFDTDIPFNERIIDKPFIKR